MSRRAWDNDSPVSSGEDISGKSLYRKTSSSGSGEFLTEALDGSLSGLSRYNERDECSDEGLERGDLMVVDRIRAEDSKGIKHLHDNWVLHRDMKTSNLLINKKGELRICDFGMSRLYGSPSKPYTSLVVTMWYRWAMTAPELLLGAKEYATAVDMWSVGCIMAELLSNEPLFWGRSEIDRLDKIFRTEIIWPEFSKLPGLKANFVRQPYNTLLKKFPATSFTGSPALSDSEFYLLSSLLTYDPKKIITLMRITADLTLNHPWFHEVPLPKSKELMPTLPTQNGKRR
ncbi:hypothetical protein K2173_001060 [Erythroxylum novogranatense]|uniref:Protein kinase domain-containing protein n=1 Tax=Erythroxylum novogranatense TaxID=1862640 RepID=A0AAV8SIX2_9ROSI|nr:hypothetical protein K2173_001060 [Erythroxylum novogranatense]